MADVKDRIRFREEDFCRVVVVRVPRHRREAFFRAMNLLPAFMACAGREDYDDYCLDFFRHAGRSLGQRNGENITPLR